MLLARPTEISQGPLNTKRALISAIVGFILTLFVYLVFSLLVLISILPEGAIRPVALIITLLASYFAGFLTSRNVPVYGLFNGLITGLIYFGITYIFGALINLSLSFNSQLFTSLLTVIIGSSLGGIVGINHRASRYRRMRRRKR